MQIAKNTKFDVAKMSFTLCQIYENRINAVRDRSLIIAWEERGGGGGGGCPEDFGKKHGEILADPPFKCFISEVIPPHNY